MRLLCALALALGLAVGMSACGSGGHVAPAARHPRTPLLPTPTPAPPAATIIGPPAGSMYLGAMVSGPQGGIAGLEVAIGRTLALDEHTYGWTTNFPGDAESARDLLAGRVPVELWTCGPTNAQIVAGDADLLIQTRATTVLQYGNPVFIAYAPDINLPVSTAARQSCLDPATDLGQTFSPVEFVAAWLHIRAIFTALGVTNAVWVWTTSSGGANPVPYYPGDAHVDWVGLDAYALNNAGLYATIEPSYPTLSSFNKPLMVTGTGTASANQPAFFTGAAATLQAQFPQIDGLIYNDANANYAISFVGLPTFADFANAAYMSAMPP